MSKRSQEVLGVEKKVQFSRILSRERLKQSGLADTKRAQDPDFDRFLGVLRAVSGANPGGTKMNKQAIERLVRP